MRVQTLFLFLITWLPIEAFSSNFLERQLRYPRVRAAYEARLTVVEAEFREAGAARPPSQLLLRNFKLEGELEVWAKASDSRRRMVKVRTYAVCAKSGKLGPKLQSGDRQVPEGIYHIDRFNPRSSYHLSLGLNYPNAVDRVRSKGLDPGGDIFVHGDCVTIGCLPLDDGPMEDLYLSAVMSRQGGQKRLPVHMFPCRFGTGPCEQALSNNRTQHHELWRSLREVYEAFISDTQLPRVRAHRKGTYQIRTGSTARGIKLTRWPVLGPNASLQGSTLLQGRDLEWLNQWNQRRSTAYWSHGPS